jgi:hypothetical protein
MAYIYCNDDDDRMITVAETGVFIRQARDLWTDADREAFVDHIALNPEAGDIIPDTGGIRKIRWTRPGSGKRGGVRVIYFYHNMETPLYLLMVYSKSVREDWSAGQKERARDLVEAIKYEYKRKSSHGHVRH